ncbi:MAG: hypothetical protein M3N51_09005 [Actinomycetota bacterium]|nr:hypothetical protein [Actinomycetota bacterium]
MNDYVVKGSRVTAMLQAPQTFESHRVCQSEECTTRLSIYNGAKFCYLHAPTSFPRVRGRQVKP